jgi:hypothetical protein
MAMDRDTASRCIAIRSTWFQIVPWSELNLPEFLSENFT